MKQYFKQHSQRIRKQMVNYALTEALQAVQEAMLVLVQTVIYYAGSMLIASREYSLKGFFVVYIGIGFALVCIVKLAEEIPVLQTNLKAIVCFLQEYRLGREGDEEQGTVAFSVKQAGAHTPSLEITVRPSSNKINIAVTTGDSTWARSSPYSVSIPLNVFGGFSKKLSLRLEDLCFRNGDGSWLFRNFSLEVVPEQIVYVLGKRYDVGCRY